MRAVLLFVLLGGCTLIDQNTFNPHAKDAPGFPVAPSPPAAIVGPPPLLVIDGEGYADALRSAVAKARARKADVVFDVVEIAAPDAAGDALGARAAGVAQAIVGQGVPASRVRLVARPEVGGRVGEVQVYIH